MTTSHYNLETKNENKKYSSVPFSGYTDNLDKIILCYLTLPELCILSKGDSSVAPVAEAIFEKQIQDPSVLFNSLKYISQFFSKSNFNREYKIENYLQFLNDSFEELIWLVQVDIRFPLIAQEALIHLHRCYISKNKSNELPYYLKDCIAKDETFKAQILINLAGKEEQKLWCTSFYRNNSKANNPIAKN